MATPWLPLSTLLGPCLREDGVSVIYKADWVNTYLSAQKVGTERQSKARFLKLAALRASRESWTGTA